MRFTTILFLTFISTILCNGIIYYVRLFSAIIVLFRKIYLKTKYL